MKMLKYHGEKNEVEMQAIKSTNPLVLPYLSGSADSSLHIPQPPLSSFAGKGGQSEGHNKRR